MGSWMWHAIWKLMLFVSFLSLLIVFRSPLCPLFVSVWKKKKHDNMPQNIEYFRFTHSGQILKGGALQTQTALSTIAMVTCLDVSLSDTGAPVSVGVFGHAWLVWNQRDPLSLAAGSLLKAAAACSLFWVLTTGKGVGNSTLEHEVLFEWGAHWENSPCACHCVAWVVSLKRYSATREMNVYWNWVMS